MKRSWILLVVLVLGAGSLALSHPGKKHILGTVAKINPDSLVIAAKNGKTIEVQIGPATVFLKDGQPAKREELALGDRVVVHATVKGVALLADEVRFVSVAKKTKP